jgi:hypothetical protein
MIFMPISILTFDLAVCNDAKAIETCDFWDVSVYLLPQNMEKIFFRWLRPEIAHKKFIMRGISHNGFMIIRPFVRLRALCNHLGEIVSEEIVFDSDHSKNALTKAE